MSLSHEERLLWAMLAESESRVMAGWSFLDNQEVNRQIRERLRLQHDVDLTVYGAEAKVRVQALLDKVKEGVREERGTRG